MGDGAADEARARGIEAFARGDFGAAVRELWLSALNPADLEARWKLGWAQCESWQLPEAVATLEAVVRDAPDQPDLHTYLGIALFRSGRQPEAEAAFQRALALDPAHATAFSWLQLLQAPPAGSYPPSVVGPGAAPGVPLCAPAPAAPSGQQVPVGPILLAVAVAFLALLGGMMVFGGVQGQQFEREFPQPKVVSYAELVKLQPKRGWFRITDACLCVHAASWKQRRRFPHAVSTIVVPIRAADDEEDQAPLHLLLADPDREIRDTVDNLVWKQGDDLKAWAKREAARLDVRQELECRVEEGRRLELDEVIRKQENLADHVIVLTPYSKPVHSAGGLIPFGGGLLALAAVLGLVFVWLWRRSFPPKPAAGA